MELTQFGRSSDQVEHINREIRDWTGLRCGPRESISRISGRALGVAAVLALHGLVLWWMLVGNHVSRIQPNPLTEIVIIPLSENPRTRNVSRSADSSSYQPRVIAIKVPHLSPTPALIDEEMSESHEEPKGTLQAQSEGAPMAISQPASDRSTLAAWQAQLYDQLARFERYPGIAKLRHQQGVVYVRFTVDRHGHVLSAAVQVSSGHAALDGEALALLRRAEPLPAPPNDLNGDRIEITVPVQFSLTS